MSLLIPSVGVTTKGAGKASAVTGYVSGGADLFAKEPLLYDTIAEKVSATYPDGIPPELSPTFGNVPYSVFTLSTPYMKTRYCPAILPLITVLLSYMEPCHVHATIVAMIRQSGASYYLPLTVEDSMLFSLTFVDLMRRHVPDVVEAFHERSFPISVGYKALFDTLFLYALPKDVSLRLLDVFFSEGSKALYRFGVAHAQTLSKLMFPNSDPYTLA
ncbi:hypothetical protein KIPB_003321, partial [Kipferlia bialata]|eukprot:g3321.t1